MHEFRVEMCDPNVFAVEITGSGPPGKSAYAYAVDGGYTGTEEEFCTTMGLSGSAAVFTASTHLDFPNSGSTYVMYVAKEENKIYRWDDASLQYVCIGSDYTELDITNKADKIRDGTIGNIAIVGEDGNPVDSGKNFNDILTDSDEGTDLISKFSEEIVDEPYNGDPLAWIRARIQSGNYTGIHVKDYIQFTTTNNVTLNAEIAGIDTYYGYGNTPTKHHIDFICRELWPTSRPINPSNYNNGLIPIENITSNGTETQYTLTKEMTGISSIMLGGENLSNLSYDSSTYTITFTEAPSAGTFVVTGTGTRSPWLSSDLYLWLNSLAGQIPNDPAFNPPVKHVDYTEDGIYYYLPDMLKSVIVEKHMLLPLRYSTSKLLSDDNSWGWESIGKLWLPTECEVYGMPVWGGKTGYSLTGSALQYPIFAGNMNRLKYNNGDRRSWWLLSPAGSYTTYWCLVDLRGHANSYVTSTNLAVPVCFRVA